MTKTDRTPCIVPFCRRTAPADRYPGEEIICAKHWRMVPHRTRRLHSLALRRRRAAERAYTSTDDPDRRREHMMQVLRYQRLFERISARVRSAAIEAAGGIG